MLVHHVRKAGAEDFLEAVSGTNGLAGAADATLVLRRPRGEADGILYVTGRDVDETEHALRFTAANGAWTLLDGPAADYAMSGTRAAISRYLRANPDSNPKAIADGTGMSRENVRKTCQRMTAAGSAHRRLSGPLPGCRRPGDTRTRKCPRCPRHRGGEPAVSEQSNGVPVVHTVAEAASILRVKESWLERQAAARKVPFTMLGGCYRFTAEHLAEIVRLNEQVPPPAADAGSDRPRHRRHEPQSETASVSMLRPRTARPRHRVA